MGDSRELRPVNLRSYETHMTLINFTCSAQACKSRAVFLIEYYYRDALKDIPQNKNKKQSVMRVSYELTLTAATRENHPHTTLLIKYNYNYCKIEKHDYLTLYLGINLKIPTASGHSCGSIQPWVALKMYRSIMGVIHTEWLSQTFDAMFPNL